MATNLFVGGLPYETTREELLKLFSACGKVSDVKLIMDRETGRSKGFAFVDMGTDAEAQAAIKTLNGTTIGARQIFINEARPQEKRPDDLSAKPGFVERRSGKDRRKAAGFSAPSAGAGSGERRESFGEKKPWADKKPWGDKPSGDRKPWAAKKPWGDKPSGEKKPWGSKPGGDKKPWGDKPRGDKPGGFGAKKWGKPGGKPSFGGKPGGFAKRGARRD